MYPVNDMDQDAYPGDGRELNTCLSPCMVHNEKPEAQYSSRSPTRKLDGPREKMDSSFSKNSYHIMMSSSAPSSPLGEVKTLGRNVSAMLKSMFKAKLPSRNSDVETASTFIQNQGDHVEDKALEAKGVFNSFSTSSLSPCLDGPKKLQPCPPLEKITANPPSSGRGDSDKTAQAQRVTSMTVRRHAPSTLLAVTRELPPRMSRLTWNIKDYQIVQKLYTGYASNVYKAVCKFSGVTVCLKSYTPGNLCELNQFQIFREVKLHGSLSHDNIIKLYGAFQQGDQVVLVQEYAGNGDLFSFLQRFGGQLPEPAAVRLVLRPFLSVIQYLHSNTITHRDIKPENILFTSDMKLKLCDFGLAINMREERAVTRAGTLEYMAPEVLNCPFKNRPEENKDNRDLYYSFHVDTWAIGVLAYELVVGRPPFSDQVRNAVECKIREDVPRFPPKMSIECKSFIRAALQKNPLERPTVPELLEHAWIKMMARPAGGGHLALRHNTCPQTVAAGTSSSTSCAPSQLKLEGGQ